MGDFTRDIRHAIRNLVRAPVFSLVTILTLALGIGANTGIFSIVNSVILRPLAYPAPDRLMFITSRFLNMGFDQFWISPPEYFELAEMAQSFSRIGAFTTSEANLTAGDRPRRVVTGLADGELLEALGVAPIQGRLFRPDETRLNGPPLAILSHELWRTAFASDASLVGRLVEVDGVKTEVVGIMPAGFDLMADQVELWLPLQLNPANRQNRGNHFLYLIGRLRDGVSREEAEAELDALLTRWEAGFKGQHIPNRQAHPLQMEPVQEEIVGGARRAIWVLQAAVGFVLLVACANLANLLLARAETRHREFAVRSALGAGRGRLLRQFMIEGLIPSLVGGALGLLVAWLGVRTLVGMYPDGLPRADEIAVDPAVLGFTFVISVLTGAVFGLAPLLHLSPSTLGRSLKEGGLRGATTGTRHVVRRALVMMEVALAVVLVIGAGLMIRTVWNLTRVDSGFNRAPLVTFALDLPNAVYRTPLQTTQFYRGLLAGLATAPGVERVSSMSGLPPTRRINANDTEIDNYTAPPEGPYENIDYYQLAALDYFETMGIPIVEGRSFQSTDVEGAPVAIVNETMVKTFWRGLNPIGQRVKPSGPADVPWMTVVGVAKDVKQGGVDQKTGTELYFLMDQLPRVFPTTTFGAGMNVVLRTTEPVDALGSTIDRIIRAADPSLPIIRLRTMEEVFTESFSRPRLLAHLLGGFAGLALLLAVIGTYGVLSYMVTERRREIGIRMALGAERGRVLGLVLGQGLRLSAMGLVAGIVGALSLGRLMTSLLFGVEPGDAATLAGVVACIGLVAAVACYLPAHRATRVEPIAVLREE
jgi:putative ABC transport system permease protein